MSRNCLAQGHNEPITADDGAGWLGALAVTVGDFSAIVKGQRDGTLQLGLTSRSVAIVPDPASTLGADFCADMPPPGAEQINWRHAGILQVCLG